MNENINYGLDLSSDEEDTQKNNNSYIDFEKEKLTQEIMNNAAKK